MRHYSYGPLRRTLVTAACSALIAVALFSTAGAALAASTPPAVAARNALLMDQASGRILWAKEIDEVVRPASLTKLMTLKLTFEALDAGKVKLNDLVPVSERAWKTGGSRMFLRVGTKVPLEEIIKGIAVASGNDACVAVAEFIGGTVENFVTMMNKRAQELGLSRTRFVDPHGLSDDNQITARDIANLARVYIRDHPRSLAYHSMRQYTFVPAGGKPVTQQNRNRLLGVYNGADGLKTGHTEAAGYNLVATAEREGTRFIGVVLGVKARTEPLGEQLRAREVAKLLDWGFGNFSTRTVLSKGEKLGEIRVFKGRENVVDVGATSEVKYTFEKNENITISKKANIPGHLVAPVKKGQVVGSVSVRVGDQEIQNVPVVALQDIPAGNVFKRILDSLRLFFQRSVKFE